MAFWGVEIKAGKSYTLPSKNTCARLKISQATLGAGPSKTTSYVQCRVGNNPPVLLCSLTPENAESIHIGIEFEEEEKVILSVIGSRSVHLTGYILEKNRQNFVGDDDSESYGEDIGESENEVSDHDEYGGSFINDDPPTSSEEVRYRKKAHKKRSTRKRLMVYVSSASEGNDVQMVDSDEDDYKVISSVYKTIQDLESSKSLHRNMEDVVGHSINKNLDTIAEHAIDDSVSVCKEVRSKMVHDRPSVHKEIRSKHIHDHAVQESESGQSGDRKKETKLDDVVGQTSSEANDRKAKRKKRKNESNVENGGLVIEELELGQQGGKVASSGKKVTVHYSGKLKEQDQVFCSTDGKSPVKFRLGKDVALDGLHTGIDGMRVGGKRRLIIPPGLGYGSQGADGVPPNAWLVMDVELLKVR